MNALSDLVLAKEKELDIQGVTARHMKVDDALWLQAKHHLNQIPANYKSIFEEQVNKNMKKPN